MKSYKVNLLDYLVMSPLKMSAVWRRKPSNLKDLSNRCRYRGLARAELPDAPTSSRPTCPDAMQHRHLCPKGAVTICYGERKQGGRKMTISRQLAIKLGSDRGMRM